MTSNDGTLQPVENYAQGDTPISNTEQLEEVLVIALREAYAYAFNKGQNFDINPDHEKAGEIKDRAKAKLEALIATHTAEAVRASLERVLEKASYTPVGGGRVYVEEIEAELAQLKSQQKAGDA